MDIIDALKWARGGYPVRRAGWPAGQMIGHTDCEEGPGAYWLATPKGVQIEGMRPFSFEDLDAVDWEVVK